MVNEAAGIRINQDYTDSRFDHLREGVSSIKKNKIKKDPNFMKAIKGFVKEPDVHKQMRTNKMKNQRKILQALGRDGKHI